jgi:pimeloyl-ACP methyl ester carboxylesterase
VGAETLHCLLDSAAGAAHPSVIFLHGGGPSSKADTGYLTGIFTSRGRSTVRFDFSGQGDSTGAMKASSLKKRHREALGVIEHFGIQGGITLIGTSMGGYVAAGLVPEIDVKELILFCPAAYDVRARDVEFGRGFTEIIRRSGSYLDTDIHSLLSDFRNEAMLITGTEDNIIPPAVIEIYRAGLKNASSFDHYTIEGCPHPIHRWVADKPAQREALRCRVADFIDRH